MESVSGGGDDEEAWRTDCVIGVRRPGPRVTAVAVGRLVSSKWAERERERESVTAKDDGAVCVPLRQTP